MHAQPLRLSRVSPTTEHAAQHSTSQCTALLRATQQHPSSQDAAIRNTNLHCKKMEEATDQSRLRPKHTNCLYHGATAGCAAVAAAGTAAVLLLAPALLLVLLLLSLLPLLLPPSLLSLLLLAGSSLPR